MKEFYDIAKDGISDLKQRHEYFESIEKQKYDLHDEIVKAVSDIRIENIKISRKNSIQQNIIIIITIGCFILAVLSVLQNAIYR